MNVTSTKQNCQLLERKWNPVLNAPGVNRIGDSHKRAVVAQLLENTESAQKEANQAANFSFLTETSQGGSFTGGVDQWTPVLVSLVRRAAPNLIAFDIASVQPMTAPTGLIFAMRSHYGPQRDDNGQIRADNEALYNRINPAYSAQSSGVTDPSFSWTEDTHAVLKTTKGGGSVANGKFTEGSATAYSDGSLFASDDKGSVKTDTVSGADLAITQAILGMDTNVGELLGINQNSADTDPKGNRDNQMFNEMSVTIEKTTVNAKTRALKAEYTMELAQDMKAVHGLDAEQELSSMLANEILAEINRELIGVINWGAKLGCQDGKVKGLFDFNTNTDGRWFAEKAKGLLFQITREMNAIAKDTRRGKGNFALMSSDLASALATTGALTYAPAIQQNAELQVDDTGNTFAGTLSSGLKVYVDPYATSNYVTVGYRGASPYDAGVFYCPYVPLTMVRAVGEQTFQPKIGFKTRYGMAANPYYKDYKNGGTAFEGLSAVNGNGYYRKFLVKDLMTGLSA